MEKVSEQGVWFHDPLMNSRTSYLRIRMFILMFAQR